MGFPCNQFGKQEPGTAQEIRQFCDLNYGADISHLCQTRSQWGKSTPALCALTGPTAAFPGKITWNFEKFLVNQKGEVQKRFSPKNNSERSGADSSPGSAALSYVLF